MSGKSRSIQYVGDKARMSQGVQWEIDLFNKNLKANPEIPENNIWECIADVDKKGCISFLSTLFKNHGFLLLSKNVNILLSNYQISGVARSWNASV